MAPNGRRGGSTGEGEPRPQIPQTSGEPDDLWGPERPVPDVADAASNLMASTSGWASVPGPTEEGLDMTTWGPEGPHDFAGYEPEGGWADTDDQGPLPGLSYEDEYAPAWGDDEGFAYQEDLEQGAGYPALEPRFSAGGPPSTQTHGGQGDERPARSRRSGNGPWPELVMVTAVAVVLAAVALAVTSANRSGGTSTPSPNLASPNLASPTSASPNSPTSASPNSPTSASPNLASPTSASASPVIAGKANANGAPAGSRGRAPTSPSPGSAATSAQTPTTRKPTAPTGLTAKNLVISSAIKQSLVDTWVATDPDGVGLTAKDVAGTVPGEVFYGYDLSISTYFAIAAFQPSATWVDGTKIPGGQNDMAPFQDNEYVFSLQTGSAWTLLGAVSTGSCPGDWVPRPVLAVWGMCGLNARAG